MSFALILYHHSVSIRYTFKDNSIYKQSITSCGYLLPHQEHYSINIISRIHNQLVDYICKIMVNSQGGDPSNTTPVFTKVLIEFINYINSIVCYQDKIIDELKEQLDEKIDENDRLKKEIKQVQINFKTFQDEIVRLNDIIKQL